MKSSPSSAARSGSEAISPLARALIAQGSRFPSHADDSLRLRAASKLLELGLKTWHVVDLESQVSELSERLTLTETMLDKPK